MHEREGLVICIKVPSPEWRSVNATLLLAATEIVMHTHSYDQDDWLARRIRALTPGWRGRVRLAPDDADSGASADIVGTVIGEAAFDRDEDDSVVDATVTLCANYQGGKFLPLAGQPQVAVRISDIVDMEPI